MDNRRCTNKDHSLYSLTLSTGIVRVVNASDFATMATIQTGTASAFCSMFVPFDETCVVVCDQLHFSLPVMNRKGFIRVFNYQTGEKKIEYQMANECYSAALLCGGKMILAGDKEHIYFYELETGRRIGMYRDIHSDVINHLVPHPIYPTVFASGSEDGLVGLALGAFSLDLRIRHCSRKSGGRRGEHLPDGQWNCEHGLVWREEGSDLVCLHDARFFLSIAITDRTDDLELDDGRSPRQHCGLLHVPL